jgi:hypothetical protein
MRASADTISIAASKDNTLIQSPTTYSNGGDPGFFVGNPGGFLRRGLIAFDIAAAVPSGATINSATLSLSVDMANHVFVPTDVTFHRLTKDWGEGTVSGNGQGSPANPGDATWTDNFFQSSSWTADGAEGDYLAASGTLTYPGTTGRFSLGSTGITADVADWLANSATNFGWLIKSDVAGGGIRFVSREGFDALSRPLLTIDYSPAAGISGSWNNDADADYSAPGCWAGSVPIGASATATFGNVISQPRQVNIDTPLSVKTINFDSPFRYTLAGTNTLTIDSSGAGAINVISGNHTISAPMSLARNTTVTVTLAASTLTISGNFTASAGVTLTKSGAGVLEISRAQSDGLSIGQGTVRLLANAGNASKVQTLSITSGAALDMTNNSLVIDYTGATVLPAVQAQLATGFHSGDWVGAGIISSRAAAIAADLGNAHKTALGYADASALFSTFPQTFNGQSIDATSVLIRYTYTGDANLDGKVNALDFNALATGFGTGSTWVSGDFNYDGTINSLDFAALAANYNLALPGPALGSLVPEPALLLGAVAPALLSTRRRRLHQPV